MKNENVKLYNVLFPVWMLVYFPLTWIIVIPGNLLIDFLVIFLTLKCLNVENLKATIKPIILKVWLIGFLSDFIGSIFMFLIVYLPNKFSSDVYIWIIDNITNPVCYNAFETIYAFLYVTMCVVIASVCIYFLNYKVAFKKCDLDDTVKKRLALSLAIFTAPVLFYLPSTWLY